MNDDIHALSGAYAVDALDDAERAAFEEHLAHCSDCCTEVAELQEAAGLLGELSATPPPPSVRESILSEISTVRPLPPLPAPPRAPAGEESDDAPVAEVVPLWRRAAAPLAAAAAVVALVGGGLAISQPWSDDSDGTSQVADPAEAVLNADDAQRVVLEFPDGARATLVRSVSHHLAVLVTEDMPAPPEGMSYQVWLQTPEGDMVDAGVMPVREDQTVVLKGDASQATGAGITVEPAGGSDEPSGEPIALFDLSRAT